MKSITIFPKNKKQESLLKSLLEEMGVNFQFDTESDNTKLTKEEFYSKIDFSIKQAEQGNTKHLSEEEQKELLGL